MSVILLGKSSTWQNLCPPERHVTPEITVDSLARAPDTAQLINKLQPITAIHINFHSAVSAGYCS